MSEPIRRVPLRRSLLLAAVGLTLVSLIAFAAALYLLVWVPAGRDIANAQLRLASERRGVGPQVLHQERSHRHHAGQRILVARTNQLLSQQRGRVPAGLLWMMFTCLGYVCFIVPGIVLHILCVINASRQPQQQLT